MKNRIVTFCKKVLKALTESVIVMAVMVVVAIGCFLLMRAMTSDSNAAWYVVVPVGFPAACVKAGGEPVYDLCAEKVFPEIDWVDMPSEETTQNYLNSFNEKS